MLQRQVGGSDLAVSVLGLGTRLFGRECDRAQARAVVHEALDQGITFFDTANSYAEGLSEEYLGDALHGRRDRAVISTKFGSLRLRRPGVAAGSRAHIREALEASLRRLRTDRIDLFQLHFPDPGTPIDETLGALDELVREGKVRHIGSSNFDVAQLAEAEQAARRRGGARFISTQAEYSLLERGIERDIMPLCLEHAIGIFPYRPLAAGLLAGRERAAGPLADVHAERLALLERFAAERGLRLLEVAIGWLAAHPAVASVMVGARTPEQVRANVGAAGWRPTADDLRALHVATGAAPEPTYARSAARQAPHQQRGG